MTDCIRTSLTETLKMKVAQAAENVINYFLSLGQFGFRDLLEKEKNI